MNIHRILFPVDFSESSRAVAPFVHSMAQRQKASVVLIHIIQPPPPVYGGLNAYDGMSAAYSETYDYESGRKAVLKNLDRFAAGELPKIETSCVVDIGDPSNLIIKYAHENSIDLIAMPSHGHGAFRRTLLGSVTAKVLHDAKVPVWMSAHAPEASQRAHPQPRHVLVAIDLVKGGRETLSAAVEIAKETEASLDIVVAVAEGLNAPGMVDAQLDELLIAGTREQLAKLQFEAGTQAGTVIAIGGPAKVVRAAALEKRADLVICGRGSGHGILGSLRDNGYAIIREAPCPVLSL